MIADNYGVGHSLRIRSDPKADVEFRSCLGLYCISEPKNNLKLIMQEKYISCFDAMTKYLTNTSKEKRIILAHGFNT